MMYALGAKPVIAVSPPEYGACLVHNDDVRSISRVFEAQDLLCWFNACVA